MQKSESEVTQSCPTLGDLMDYSLPGFLRPWGFPGKSTGVGCHCLLQIKYYVIKKKKASHKINNRSEVISNSARRRLNAVIFRRGTMTRRREAVAAAAKSL